MLQIRQLDIYVSIALVGLGVYVAYQGLDYGYLEDGTPAAGFFPFWVGIGLAVFSAINLYRLARRQGLSLPGFDDAVAYGEIGKVLGASAIMAAFIGLSFMVGMTVSIFLLMLAIGAVFGPRNRRFYLGLVLLSAAMTAILHFTFASLLGVPLL